MENNFFKRAARLADQFADIAEEKLEVAKAVASKRIEEIKIKSSLHEAMEVRDALFAEYGKLIFSGDCDEEQKVALEESIVENSEYIAELEAELASLTDDGCEAHCECDCKETANTEQKSVFCSKCGTEFPSTENFCSKCGALLHKD